MRKIRLAIAAALLSPYGTSPTLLPVIVISALFGLAQLSANSIGQSVRETRLRVRRAKIEAADFECTQSSL